MKAWGWWQGHHWAPGIGKGLPVMAYQRMYHDTAHTMQNMHCCWQVLLVQFNQDCRHLVLLVQHNQDDGHLCNN